MVFYKILSSHYIRFSLSFNEFVLLHDPFGNHQQGKKNSHYFKMPPSYEGRFYWVKKLQS